jgi:four helix bundle protein
MKPGAAASPGGMKPAQTIAVTPEELQERTLRFAVAVFDFVRPLFRHVETNHVAQQLLRCSSSIALNYRAACLARSHREWTAKIGIVREESDESLGWLIFVDRAGITSDRRDAGKALLEESLQLARIFGASFRTSREKERNKKRATRERQSLSDEPAEPK